MKKIRRIINALVLVLCLTLCLAALSGCTVAVNDDTASAITLEAASTVLDIVAKAAIALIGVGGAWLTAKISQNKKLANIGQAVDQVVQAAKLTVGELQQTTVGAMKAAAADGKLTEAQIADLKKQLLQKTAEKLAAPAVQLLEAAKADVNAIIAGAAEDFINSMKVPASSTVTPISTAT